MIEDIQNTANDIEDNETCCSDTSCCPSQSPFIRTAPKLGRNDPCLCGSGHKFKKCCGRNS
ncbi:MAG: SEC-C metal-binding domain-containing protein [Cellvibrionaceae bacterium]